MEKKKRINIYDKYPALGYILPIVGGFFAWYASQVIWIGLFVLFGGLILNWIHLHDTYKK